MDVRVLYLSSDLSEHLEPHKEHLPSRSLPTPAPSLPPGPGSRLVTPIPSSKGSRSNSLAPFNGPSPTPAPSLVPKPRSVQFHEDGSIDANFDDNDVLDHIEIDDGESDGGDGTDGVYLGSNGKNKLSDMKGGEQSDGWEFPSPVERAEFEKLSPYEQERETNIRRHMQLLHQTDLTGDIARLFLTASQARSPE